MDNLGQNLKALRKSRGASQQNMADMLGVSLRTYQFYERGEYEPNIAYLCSLADYFQVSLDYLVGRSERVEIAIHLPERLRAQRERAGLSQAEAAERLCLAARAYRNYEDGSQRPDLETLAAMARLFQATTDHLLGLDGEEET